VADFAFWNVPLHAIDETVDLIGIFLSEDFFQQVDNFEPFLDELFFIERDVTAEVMCAEFDYGRELIASIAKE